MGPQDDLPADKKIDPLWWILAVLVGGGGLSGFYASTQTSDRYYGTEARADFAERDQEITLNSSEIEHLRERLDAIDRDYESLRRDLQALDERHPPEDLLNRMARLEDRQRAAELFMERIKTNGLGK